MSRIEHHGEPVLDHLGRHAAVDMMVSALIGTVHTEIAFDDLSNFHRNPPLRGEDSS
jgi:hypothetical protein